MYDKYINTIRSYDPVDYCNENFYLKLAGIHEIISTHYRKGHALGSVIDKFHSRTNQNAHSLGLGARVALIDSGIAPHPMLPSLSAHELRSKSALMHWSIHESNREPLCKLFDMAESQCNGAAIGTFTHEKDAKAHPDLCAEAVRAADRFKEDLWTGWEKQVESWIKGRRQETRPGIPCFQNIFGAARMISPLSRSFLQGDLAKTIIDNNGHGTGMAGIISALPPDVNCSTSANAGSIRNYQATELGLNIVGVAPYSELLVLKCCDNSDPCNPESLDGTIITALDALAYILDHKVDVVLFGFAMHGCAQKSTNGVTILLDKIKQANCIVIAPAGNDPNMGALGFPASSPHANAIAAVTIDPNNQSKLIRAEYSAMADKSCFEEIAFSAFGGDSVNQILTTSKDFGFKYIFGTSVSAAIVAGVYAASISSACGLAFSSDYDNYVSRTGQIDTSSIRNTLERWTPNLPVRASIEASILNNVTYCEGWKDPDAQYKVGAGVVRI